VYTDHNELLTDLSYDVQQHLQLEEQNFDFDKVKLKDTSTIRFSSSWVGLVGFWCYLQYPDCSRQRFVDELTIYYKDQEHKLKVLENFKENYTGENAIQWYTKDTFIYNLLNSALRQHNIKLLFLYGFFLQDLHRQLVKENDKFRQKNLENPKLTLYRGQRISRSEIDYIKDEFTSYDLLVNKSFFSTTLNRNTALIYVDPRAELSDNIQNILFEIEIDLNTKSSYPFTDISHLSQFPMESEILFMIGTTFKINTNEINFKEDENLWPIKLTLTSSYRDYEPNLKTTGDKRALKDCINLLPKVTLNYMNDISIDQLDIIFQELFVMYPCDIQWISAIQQRTLAIYQQIHVNNYESALLHYNDSVKLWSDYVDDEELNCLRNIAKNHFDMAMCYHFYLYDIIMANKHYDAAIQFYHLALERHTTTIHEKIKIYTQLSDVYDRKIDINNDYTIHDYGFKGIKYYKLYIRHLQKVYAMEDYWAYVNMSKLYIIHHEFDKAILTYKKAIKVYQQRNKNIRQSEVGYDIESVYRRLITIYTNYRPNYELAIYYQLMLHEHNMQSNFRTLGYSKDHDRYEMMDDKQHESDCKKDLLALHLRRLAKINQSFNNDDLARAQLLEALDLYNEIRHMWVDGGIESINIQLLLLNPQRSVQKLTL